MNSKKFFSRAAIAGVAAAALVMTGATAASAAEGRDSGDGRSLVQPQSNGSLDTYFLLDGGTGAYVETDANSDGWLDTAFAPSKTLVAVGNNNGTVGQAATYAAIDPAIATGGAAWTQVYAVLDDDISAGRSSWSAWTQSNPGTGANTGKVPAFENLTLTGKTAGSPGIKAILAAGGQFQHGLAFTINNGQTVVGAIYRTVDITAGGTYRISAVEYYTAPAPDFANYAATAGASATLRNGNLAISATAANAGKTVDVWVEGEAIAKHTDVVLSNAGDAIVTSDIAEGKRIAVTEAGVVVVWMTTATYVVVQPNDTDNAATKVAIPAPAEGVTTIAIPAGAANANQTFTALGWSAPTSLGPVTTDASGVATVNASALGTGTHTVALVDASDEIVAWGTVEILPPTTDSSETDVTVEVAVSGKFALEGVVGSIALGTIERGQTATSAIPTFTVFDDREDLKGWTLNAAVDSFRTGAGDTIAGSALRIAPRVVAGESSGVTVPGSALNGSGVFAEGAVGSLTYAAGTQFAADLSFEAPLSAKAGLYSSKLTLTLVSK